MTEESVKIEILYCGVSHSDARYGSNQLGSAIYPLVAGHEIIGRVIAVGEEVSKVSVGDHVGVGFMVDSCLKCDACLNKDEQYCAEGVTATYGGKRAHGRVGGKPELPTYGGYSASHVVHEHFVVKIPDGMDLKAAAPLLGSGVTIYDPLRHWGFTDTSKPRATVGIVGIGAMGVLGIQIAAALGHDVLAISHAAVKEQVAKEAGAVYFAHSTNPKSMERHAGSCDIILNTLAVDH